MRFLRYRPDELRHALARMVRWRWPRERLLVTADCVAEWPAPEPSWEALVDGEEAAAERLSSAPKVAEPGVLGVTQERVVYQNHTRIGGPVRLAAGLVAVVALALLAASLIGFALAVVVALGLWATARVLEAFGIGNGTVRLSRVLHLDEEDRLLHGLDDWGTYYRLRFASAWDFHQVARAVAKAI